MAFSVGVFCDPRDLYSSCSLAAALLGALVLAGCGGSHSGSGSGAESSDEVDGEESAAWGAPEPEDSGAGVEGQGLDSGVSAIGRVVSVEVHPSGPALEFVRIEPGEFVMGLESPPLSERIIVGIGLANEQESNIRNSPPTRVTFTSAFYVARRNILVREYVEFLNDVVARSDEGESAETIRDRYVNRDPWYDFAAQKFNERSQIVLTADGRFAARPGASECVLADAKFEGAMAFAAWTGRSLGGFPGEVSLPTEAEWAYVARGPSGRPYTWGSFLPPDADRDLYVSPREPLSASGDYSCNSAMQRPAGDTPEGVADLMGGFEWTLDYFTQRLPGGSLTDPKPVPLDAAMLDSVYGPRRSVRGFARGDLLAANRWSWSDDEGAEIRLVIRFE